MAEDPDVASRAAGAGEPLGPAGTLARFGPYAVLAAAVVAAVGGAALLVLLDVSLSPAQRRTLPAIGLGGALSALGLALLYQAAFVLHNPEAAIEHDVHPPSRYDLSFETERGARRTAALTVVAGLVSILLGGVGFWAIVASQ